MKLPKLNWIYGGDHKKILYEACCHFLDCCVGVECADLRFKVKTDKPYEGLHTEVVHRFACSVLHPFIQKSVDNYAKIYKDDKLSEIGIGSAFKNIDLNGLLINTNIKKLGSKYELIQVDLKSQHHNNELTTSNTYCGTSYSFFEQVITRAKKTPVSDEDFNKTLSQIDNEATIKGTIRYKSLERAARVWAFCGNGGSLIYIPLREHKKFHQDMEMHGGLYLYNPSGKQISIGVSQLEYCRAMLHLIGNLDKVVLFTDAKHKQTVLKNIWENWRKELKKIFEQWKRPLEDHIKKNHDYNKTCSEMVNNLWLYEKLTYEHFFTKVSDGTTYERLKKINDGRGSLVGIIAGLFERFKCAGVSFKLKYDDNNYENVSALFDKICGQSKTDNFLKEWHKKGLGELKLDDEIDLIDFIYILSNCGIREKETLAKREVCLELFLFRNNGSLLVKLCGKNIDTTKAYPYCLKRDIADPSHNGDSKEIFGVLEKIKMHNLYANRFLLPIASEQIDTKLIDLEYDPTSVGNYYDWDGSKACFCITVKCGAV